MTRWLLWRELALMMRTRALWIAMAIQVAVLTALILSWGDGVPVLPGSFVAQFASLHLAMLMGLLPWVAARSPSSDVRDLALVTAQTPCSPGRVVMIRSLALALVLVVTAASATPAAILALRTDSGGAERVVPGAMMVLAVCVFVATAAIRLVVSGFGRGGTWLIATTATIGVAVAVPDSVLAGVFFGGAALLIGASAVAADRRLRFPAVYLFADPPTATTGGSGT